MYVVKCAKTKPHFTSTRELAEGIAADLSHRFGVDCEITEEPGPPTYDPGGSLRLGFPVVNAGLVRFNAQHHDVFRHRLERYLTEAPRESFRGPYYKIHGGWGCICLTPQEAHFTLALL